MDKNFDEVKEYIDKEIEEGQDITQSDKVDDSVEEHLGQMGFLWDRVNKKLQADKVCFVCKKSVEEEFKNKTDVPRVLEVNSTDPGIVVFACVCVPCYEKMQKEIEQKAKEGEKK